MVGVLFYWTEYLEKNTNLNVHIKKVKETPEGLQVEIE